MVHARLPSSVSSKKDSRQQVRIAIRLITAPEPLSLPAMNSRCVPTIGVDRAVPAPAHRTTQGGERGLRPGPGYAVPLPVILHGHLSQTLGYRRPNRVAAWQGCLLA